MKYLVDAKGFDRVMDKVCKIKILFITLISY